MNLEYCAIVLVTVSYFAFQVLRLLNEQSGEERVVHLWDEWYVVSFVTCHPSTIGVKVSLTNQLEMTL